MKALVTGGCGFIGSHVARRLVADGWEVTNVDKLTYAANPANVADLEGAANYRFVEGDLCDAKLMRELVTGTHLVFNFAGETHVDRSLFDSAVFARTDVEGVVCLLEAIRADGRASLLHMSTDEVYGPIGAPDEANEERPFAPTSPYSASKAAAELMIRSYCSTYELPVAVVRSCNVYGPNQHLEKFLPLFITRALAGERLPLYGDGLQEREWLYVDDLVRAITLVAKRSTGRGLDVFNVGSGERLSNLEFARRICELTERPFDLIAHVLDRPGHDRRYAVDSSKLRAAGWRSEVGLDQGLPRCVDWYRTYGETRAAGDPGLEEWMAKQYSGRLA